MIDREIIVLGGNHVNLLGVVRSLGEAGISSHVIIQDVTPYVFSKKSKYVKSAFITKEDDQEILDILEKFVFKNKAILIPTSDYAVSFLDRNYSKLKKNFLVPNAGDKQNNIIHNMDKFEQQRFCKELGLATIFSKKISLMGKNIDISDIPFPCIVKPNSSFEGKKADIAICNSKIELEEVLHNLLEKGYEQVLVQEVIEYENEIDIIGFSKRDKTYFSSIIEKCRISPPKRGSTSFGRTILMDPYSEFLEKLEKYFIAIGYEGVFDIDVFKTSQGLIFNEINFRNGANTYALNYNHVNVIYLWILLLTGFDIGDQKSRVDECFYFVNDMAEMVELRSKNISFFEYFRSMRVAKIGLFFNWKDMKPFIYKYIYAVVKRIRRG